MFISTKDSNHIADFLAFLSACYDGEPEALRRAGASAAEVAEVEGLAGGYPLPPFYVAYLREFGRDNGRTKIGADGQATVAAILEHYSDPVERGLTPPGGLVIGVGRLIHSRMLVWPHAGGEPPVGCFLGEPIVEYYTAASFKHLCYQSSWIEARFGRSAGTALQKQGSNALASVASVFSQFGATKYWFSDEYGVYGDSDRLACLASLEAGTTWVSVAGRTAAEREQVRDELRLTLGFR